MNPAQIKLIQSSWRKVLTTADVTTDRFFERLFEAAPETRDLFASDMSAQKKTLFATLNRLVGGLNDMKLMRSNTQDLFLRYGAHLADAGHHSAFGEAMLATLEETLADNWNDDLKSAWSAAHDVISTMMLDAAKSIADTAAKAEQEETDRRDAEAAEAEEQARAQAEAEAQAKAKTEQEQAAEQAKAVEQAEAEAEAEAEAKAKIELEAEQNVKKRKRRNRAGSFGSSMSADQKKVQEEQATGPQRQLVVFDLETERYGLDISAVREIIRLQDITAVPRTPDFVEGVINLRGKVIPVVDLRKRFEMEPVERDEDFRIVVVDVSGDETGMIVDAVTEVSRVPESGIEPPSSVITADDADYLTGIAKTGDEMIILLDIGKLISTETRRVIASAAPDLANPEEAQHQQEAA